MLLPPTCAVGSISSNCSTTPLDTITSFAARPRRLARRLRGAIADRPIAAGKADPIAATASLGVATLTPDDNAQSLIGAADAMLYAAKHAGRNRVIGPAG